MSSKGIIIGIAGASGSGKTMVAQTLLQQLPPDKVAILQEDAYYKDLSHLALHEREKSNFDHPEAFDHSLLIQHLKKLILGKSVNHPLYDYTSHCRKKKFKKFGPFSIVLLEGILILSIPEIRDLINIKIYIDTPIDICLIRRLQRDILDRKRNINSVLKQYQETVRPMYLKYIEPSKRYADILLPFGNKNFTAIDIIKSKIESFLT
jgi:uridine kinase